MPLELASWPCDFGRVPVGGREGVEMLRDWYENLVKVAKEKQMVLWIAPRENDVYDNTWSEALDNWLQHLARSGNFIANRTDPGAESQNWPTPRWLGSLVRIVVLWNDMETWIRMSTD